MSQQSVRQAARRSQLAEFRVLWDLRRDFMVLQDEMVKAYAMLGTLAAPVELQPCQDEPAAGIWDDQTSA